MKGPMMKAPVLTLTALLLTACVAPTATTPVVTNSQTFTLADGSTIAVTRSGLQARLSYPASYRLTDAEAVSYIEDGTGCRPGTLQGSSFDDYSNTASRSYSLICS